MPVPSLELAESRGQANTPQQGRPALRVRGRPRKPQPVPNSKGLPALPVEVIGRIATFLLPEEINTAKGFAPPTELPYGFKKGIKQQTKRYPYGGIPSGVRDVVRLARTCKAIDGAVSLVIGKMGDASTTDKKSTLYVCLPDETHLKMDDSTLPFEFRTAVRRSACNQLLDRIGRSSSTLEKLIVHKCPHDNDTAHPLYPLYSVQTFQDRGTTFPKLQFLQLGPDICCKCWASVLRLFCGKTFPKSSTSVYTESGRWMQRYAHDGLDGRDSDDADSALPPAAPEMKTLVLYAEPSARNTFPLIRQIQRLRSLIGNRDRIEMLQLWLPEPPGIGGFSSTGTVIHLPSQDTKTVEQGLTEWAEQELAKQTSTQDRLLAKFAAQAKTALPPVKRKRVDDSATKSTNTDIDGPTRESSVVSEDAASVKCEIKSESSDDDEANSSPNPATGSPGRVTRISRVLRSAHRSDDLYKISLSTMAQVFPNLIGLSVLRTYSNRPALVEGMSTLEEITNSFVEPLSKLHRLRYLDLGLAVVAPIEVTDFPLGLSLSSTRLGKRKAKDLDSSLQALKRRKYTLDMKQAKTEGDKWRMSLLEKLVDLRDPPLDDPHEEDEEDKRDGSESPRPNGARSESTPFRQGSSMTWPRSLRSGYLVVPDLENRLRGRGLMMPWRVSGQKIIFDQPSGMSL